MRSPRNRYYNKYYIGVDVVHSNTPILLRFTEASYQKGQYCFHYQSSYLYQPGWHIALAGEPFKTKKVVLAIHDAQVLKKTLYVGAKLSAQEKKEYCSFEMERLAHCAREELFLDFRVLEKLDNYQDKILCVAVKRQSVESIIEIFKHTSFKVEKILLDSEISQFFEHNNQEYQKSQALAIAAFQQDLFNFLPWREKKRQFYQKLMVSGGVFIIISCMFCYFFYPNFLGNNQEKIKPQIKIATKKRPLVVKKILPVGHSLNDTPLKTLKMLGVIKNNRLTWGLIRTPDGKIVPINLGDNIGLEQAKVIAISPRKIILVKHQRKYVLE